jgi:hypothetical protein
MADDKLNQELEQGLDKATQTMSELQSRLESGEPVDEKELTVLSRLIAAQIENVRAALEQALGPLDPDFIREEMRKQLSPEEFEEWLAGEEDRKRFREELAKEKQIEEQFGEPSKEVRE